MNDNNHKNNKPFQPGKIFLSCLLAVFMAGCSWSSPENEREMPPTNSHEPIVYIYPVSTDLNRASIAIPPFRIPADMEAVKGEEVAALFQQTLLREQAFRKAKLVPDPYGTIKEAMKSARSENVDLVMTGKVNYILPGSSLGGGKLNLSIRVIDLNSSDTVWFLEQTVDQEMTYPDNSLLKRLSRIFSPPPVPAKKNAPTIPVMLSRISRDMTRIIKAGHYQPSYNGGM